MHAMAIRLFAYGTLQLTQGESRRLHAIAAVPGTVEGFGLYDSGLGWPFAAPAEGAGLVHGQILTLPGDRGSAEDVARAFLRADEWEDYDPTDPTRSLFVRERVEATAGNGARTEAHVYLSSAERLRRRYPGLRVTLIEGGIWCPGPDRPVTRRRPRPAPSSSRRTPDR